MFLSIVLLFLGHLVAVVRCIPPSSSSTSSSTSSSSSSTSATSSFSSSSSPSATSSSSSSASPSASGIPRVDLGAAGTYGALCNSSIANTGNTFISGDIGTLENNITGFPPGTFSGSEYAGQAVVQAYEDAGDAFNQIIELEGAITLTGNLEDNSPLYPGLYSYTDNATLAGPLQLAGTTPEDQWYFQIGDTLKILEGSSVIITGGSQPCNVFWVMGNAAEFSAESILAGVVIANYEITLGSGAFSDGGLIAGGLITLDDGTVSAQYCPPSSSTSSSSTMATSSSSSSMTLSSSSSSASPTSSSYSNSSSSSTIASSSSSCPSPTPSTVPLVELGSAGEYGVLGAGEVTNTGSTNVSGNIGGREGISGHPFAQGIESTGSVTLDALEDAGNAYHEIEALIGGIEISSDLGGLNLGPGIYDIDGPAMLNGTLTLDATSTLNERDLEGNNFWYFQLESTLTTDVDSVVAFIGDAQPCNVFWMVPSTATFGSDSTFVGNVLAENIEADSGADFYGGLYAYDISLDANTVFVNCPPQATASSSAVPTATSTSPSEPTNTSPGSPATETGSPAPTESSPGSPTTETGSPVPTETSPGSSPGEPGSPTSTGSTNPPVFTGSGNARKGWTISGTLILVFLLNTFGY